MSAPADGFGGRAPAGDPGVGARADGSSMGTPAGASGPSAPALGPGESAHGLPRLVAPGDPRHGVVRYARELAGALGAPLADPDGPAASALHLHFTERAWAPSPEAAAERIEALAARAPLTVTLHDVPQASDGRALARRVACYRRVVRAARAVACSSEHEAALLREHVDPALRPVVLPLPVIARELPAARPERDAEVALLGFFYPGKGHAEAVVTVAALNLGGLGVTALGAASPGHEADLERLAADAEAMQLRFTVTGYLPEDELLAACRRAAVPLAAHRHVSAAGSIGSWIAAGRRPLVPEGPYAAELSRRRPGTITTYARGGLATAIADAYAAPESTWLAAGVATGPGLREVAEAYATWWATGVRW